MKTTPGDVTHYGTSYQPVRKRFKRMSWNGNGNGKRKSNGVSASTVNRMIDRKLSLNLEKKFKDQEFSFSTASGADFPSQDGFIVDLSAIAQGVEVQERTGDMVVPTSLEFSYLLYSPNASGQIPGFFLRQIIFIWIGSDVPTPANILTDRTAFRGLLSPFTHNDRESRKILMDQRTVHFDYPFQGTTGSVTGRVEKNVAIDKIVINLKPLMKKWGPIRFDATATTGQRKIWWMGISNIADASVSQMWNLVCYSRLNYKDA